MSAPAYWAQATKELSKRDKVLGKLIRQYSGDVLTTRGDAFYTLARSIAGQQISVKAADAVWLRVAQALGQVTPQAVLAATAEDLRACGLSQQKIAYLRNIAEYFTANAARVEAWPEMDDEALIADLVQMKGVGRWTAEMMLIFHFLRPDVFPLADLGVIKAVQMHYGRDEILNKQQIIALSESWSPWRSVATWYLWRSLDPIAVLY